MVGKEQMIRRFGPAPDATRRYTRRPGIYALLPRGGKVLLTRQDCPPRGPGMAETREFQLPGGGVDPGESPLAALHREVFEETGWRIAPVRRLGAFRRFTWMPEYALWAEKICVIYLAQPLRRLGPATEPGHTAHWMAPETAARQLASEGDRDALRRYLTRIPQRKG